MHFTSVSNDGRYLAYAIDDNGSERFEVRVKDLDTGEHLPDVIPGMLSEIVWTADDAGFLYGLANEQWRTDNARFHRLGTPISDDVVLFHEEDEGFRVGVGETSSRKWIVIATSDHVTSELYLLPAHEPLAVPILVSARKVGGRRRASLVVVMSLALRDAALARSAAMSAGVKG